MCPLCLHPKSELFDQDKQRNYYKCSSCDLIFVQRNILISEDLERKRYESHENSEEDSGYRSYLEKIAHSIKDHLNPDSIGLDFGCGKTKLLAELLVPHQVHSYDLYFHPDDEIFSKKFDFIILSEVIEHLRDPHQTMLQLNDHLKPNGQIFIKTKLRPQLSLDFSQWFYKRDITHVQFFNSRSFEELAKLCGLNSPQEVGEDLYLFKK